MLSRVDLMDALYDGYEDRKWIRFCETEAVVLVEKHRTCLKISFNSAVRSSKVEW